MTRFVSALRRAPHLRITGERQRLLASFAAVFLFGLLAQGYAFTNFTVSHDSLNEMFLSGDIRYAAGSVADWKISLGRFLYPAYRAVFSGGAGTPWLSGVLSLVWVSLAVYLVSRLFSVDNALLLAVIGALFVTNVSYSALAATYIYDLDGDMLAMLLAVCAAYLLLRGTLRRRALAVIPIVGSLALYQAMISVTVSLVMIACILPSGERERESGVFRRAQSRRHPFYRRGRVLYSRPRRVQRIGRRARQRVQQPFESRPDDARPSAGSRPIDL